MATTYSAPPAPPRGRRDSRTVQAVAVLGAVSVALVAVSWRDPHETGSLGLCPFHALTGMYCPGCGTLRALHDVLHGNVAEAFGHNVLTVPALALLVAWAAWTLVGARRRTLRVRGSVATSGSRAWVPLVLSGTTLVVMVAFSVLRNLPGSALAP